MLDWNDIFAAVPTLITTRCTLRPVTANDAENMLTLYRSPEVNRFLGRLPMTTLDDAQERVNMVMTRMREQGGMTWMLYCGDDFIGNVVIFNLVKSHFRAEVGYSILPDWWGKGLVPEALRALIRYAFTDMGLHSLEAKIDPANNGSRRVLEKLGFAQEGYFRESFYDPTTARFVDTAVFSLVNSPNLSIHDDED